MRVDEIPQDDSILEGHRRVCYARDRDGHFVPGTSRGWDVERIANQQAVGEIAERIVTARAQVAAGQASPLLYHMHCAHLESRGLARQSGLWHWRVKRHLDPRVFARLDDAVLQRYAKALGIAVSSLRQLPD